MQDGFSLLLIESKPKQEEEKSKVEYPEFLKSLIVREVSGSSLFHSTKHNLFTLDEYDYMSYILAKKAWYVPKKDNDYFESLKHKASLNIIKEQDQ